MTVERLLRLYPRAWRQRYGDEFIAAVGSEALRPQQVIDIVAGAIDAWLSAEVRNATKASTVATTTGGMMTLKSMASRNPASARYTTRDSLIGAAVMIAGTLLMVLAATFAQRRGWPLTGEVILSLSFLAPFTLTMPLWLMKGQPWKAQAVIVGGTMAVLLAISLLNAG